MSGRRHFGVFVSGIDCAQWAPSPEDGQGLYVCAGTTLTIPWQLNLNSGETIKEVQWYFRGQSEEVIALKVHGQFLPMATFSQRVTSHLNAGIQLDHVTTGDSGAFSVEVTTLDSSGALSSLRHTVHVYVAGGTLLLCILLYVYITESQGTLMHVLYAIFFAYDRLFPLNF